MTQANFTTNIDNDSHYGFHYDMQKSAKFTQQQPVPQLKPIVIALSLAYACSAASVAQAETTTATSNATLQEVKVTATAAPEPTSEQSGSYTVKKSGTATRLDIPLRETPQTASVVTRTQMNDFNLNNANAVLGATTGVTVEKIETDRTYYTARGFDIASFQVDGIGLPFTSVNSIGDIDTAIYDRVEIIKGANGLAQGSGNPSATVNFVRKRPTDTLQASGNLSYGSWDNRRAEADISGPVNKDGSVRARFVAVDQATNSYLDRYSHKKYVVYGVVEADLGNATTATLGYSQQRNEAKGVMWGALPLYFTDGTATNYDRSTSTAADWSYWNTTNKTAFAELSHRFDNDWKAKLVLTHKDIEGDSKLFYAYGTPDKTTGLGLQSYPSSYSSVNRQDLADIQATGKVELGGRKHDVIVGANISKSKMTETSGYGSDIGTNLPDLNGWNGSYPMPSFDASTNGSAYTDRQHSLYAATRINVADNTKVIVGANATSISTRGSSYGVDSYRSASNVTPYVGFIYDITPNLSAYASYTGIFNPQSEIDVNRKTLDPVKGKSKEVGLKSDWLDKKLQATVSLFKAEQNNAAESAGYLSDGTAYYKGVDTRSQGFEIDIAGQITPRLQINTGFTHLSIKDKDGNEARTYVPRNLFKLSTTYRVPGIDRLKVGASVTWQDDIYRVVNSTTTIRQKDYALLNLMAKYDFSEKVSLTLNLNNVTNQKYINSLYWEQGYYGAPINGGVTLSMKY